MAGVDSARALESAVISSINPKDGRLIQTYAADTDAAVEQALRSVDSAFQSLRRQSIAQRGQLLRGLADLLDQRCMALAKTITDEMGKTLAAARSEIRKCAWVCRYYADNAGQMLAERTMPSESRRACSVIFRPLGPILAVMPWNFPFWQVFRFAAPAVMAGNVILLKHASNVPGTALTLQALFTETGFEPGVLRTLLIGPDKVEPVLADPRVTAATITGSLRAGSSVAAIAGRHVKKTVLELGGSDPFIVMPSADLERACEAAVRSRIQNNGQSCIAAKRFLIHEDVYDEFAGRLIPAFESLQIGDPLDAATDVGPLAKPALATRLASQISALKDRGAAVLTGASEIAGSGYYFQPGIVAGGVSGTEPFDEEIFGPVAWLQKVASLDDAISVANCTRFGLGASLWSRESREIHRAVREIEAGATFVNAMLASEPRLPFGGVKQSGYGRELSDDGILEFVNRKTVVIDA